MSLLIESGEDGASELLAALLTGKIIPGLSTLQELLEDEDASAELLVELQRLSTMPEDAAVRWADRCAHGCAAIHCRALRVCDQGRGRIAQRV